MTITISARGQMVIPAPIRHKYGIKAQSKVELLDLGNEVVIVPVLKQSLLRSRGALKGVSTNDLIAVRKKGRKAELAKHG